MGNHIVIKKGLDIKLIGEPGKVIPEMFIPETVALKPPDFPDITPRLLINQGEEVRAGTPLFCDKNNEAVKFCATVSGEVVEIQRGEKRKITAIKILADRELSYLPFKKANPDDLTRQEIIDALLSSGVWPFIRQRPFGIIASPNDTPKSIFISAFDSNPLAPDNDFIMKDEEVNFQTGLNALRKLSGGKVHLNINPSKNTATVFTAAQGVQINKFSGPHPAGNVGVQIHHIDPINKGEVVWCVAPQDVLVIGRLFNHGRFDTSRVIALTGSQVKNPKYFRTIAGCAITNMLAAGGLKEGSNRVISGNVLTGKKISSEGYLDFYDFQITVIPEGDTEEFMGWLFPGINKFSMSRTFFSWLNPNKKHELNTNMHGEERPFVVTGEYEKVFPMDIYPVHLLKSILIQDIELMENLGIYEVVEEDFALCEFVCTSKIESQDIIRRGIDIIRKELS